MVAVFLLACAQQEPVAPPPSVPATEGAVPTDQTVPTLLGEVQGVTFVGEWTSPPCAGRFYARNVVFEVEQRFAVVDIVDPCAPGAECAWSGLTTFSGIWAMDGTKLRVREIGGSPAAAGGPHPVLFEANADGNLVENGCLYSKGLTVPPGYTAERVRPVVPP